MENEWDAYAGEWDSNPDVVAYADFAFTDLTQFLPLTGKRILDFGCGTGQLTQRLAESADHIVALDGSAEMISMLKAKKIANVTCLSGFLDQETIISSPVLAAPFDIITASSVLSFVPDLALELQRLFGLLTPGGALIHWDWLSNGPETHGFTAEEIERAFKQSGFVDLQIATPFDISTANGKTTKVLRTIACK